VGVLDGIEGAPAVEPRERRHPHRARHNLVPARQEPNVAMPRDHAVIQCRAAAPGPDNHDRSVEVLFYGPQRPAVLAGLVFENIAFSTPNAHETLLSRWCPRSPTNRRADATHLRRCTSSAGSELKVLS